MPLEKIHFSNLFRNFYRIFLKCYRGYFLLFQLIAFVLTFIVVSTNFDWVYFKYYEHTEVRAFLFPAMALGYIVPILLPIFFFAFGFMRNSRTLVKNGLILAQVNILALFTSSFYKAFTGRLGPPLKFTTDVDTSHIFRFGFFDGGVFWGWPSSHTTVAFALATILYFLYPKKIKTNIFSILFAVYVGFGVSMTIHWFSDFLAGAFLGIIIGLSTYFTYQKNSL